MNFSAHWGNLYHDDPAADDVDDGPPRAPRLPRDPENPHLPTAFPAQYNELYPGLGGGKHDESSAHWDSPYDGGPAAADLAACGFGGGAVLPVGLRALGMDRLHHAHAGDAGLRQTRKGPKASPKASRTSYLVGPLLLVALSLLNK